MILPLKILCIVLAILCGLTLLFLLFTVPRIGVRILKKESGLTIWLRYGWLRIRLFPLPFKQRTVRPKAEQAKAEKEEKVSSFNLSNLDVEEALYLLLDLLEELKDTLRFETVSLNVMLGTGNAATTGMLLGACAAISGMILPFVERNFEIRDCKIIVDADFDADQTHWQTDLAFSIRPVRLIWALIKRWRKLKYLYHSMRR